MKTKLAFTLLEMSITILIIGIVLVGGINFQLSLTDSSHKNITEDRLRRIQSAIDEYIIENGRLPCPSNLLISNNNINFGNELRHSDNQECYSANTSFEKSNLIYGGLPTKVLNLTNDFGVDGWNNRIIYIIDKNYATGESFLRNGGESITIKNLKNNNVTNKAIYVLFSSGENRNGAFNNGIQLNSNTSLKDYENAFKNNFNNLFIKDIKEEDFDDLLFYKEKKDILLSLVIEDALCNLKDLSLLDIDYTYTSNPLCSNGLCEHGVEISSKTPCLLKISKNPQKYSDNTFRPVRKCLKYGEWSEILYQCEEGCFGELNIYDVVGGNFSTPGKLKESINLDYIKRAKNNEEITLECINNKSGYVTIKCIDSPNGWRYMTGDCYEASSKL